MSSRNRRFSLQLRQYRALLLIVLFTSAIWFVMSMSEHRSFPARVHIEWTGYDSARYVVVSADSLLPLTLVSNGWQELIRNIPSNMNRCCVLHVASDTTVAVADIFGEVERQMGYHALHGFSSSLDSLRLQLTERCCKAFVPDLSKVQFSFANHVGLGGTPRFDPDTVWIYGSEASLSHLQTLPVAAAVIANISDSGSYLLDLEPVWYRYPDLHPSVRQVRLILPTKAYTEKQFLLPVRLIREDTNLQVRLYPDVLRVTMLVPESDFPRLTADRLAVEADLSLGHNGVLHPHVTRFPAYARVKSIEPAELQYVLIKH